MSSGFNLPETGQSSARRACVVTGCRDTSVRSAPACLPCREPLPPLFMRFVMQAGFAWPALTPLTVDLLCKLIGKQARLVECATNLTSALKSECPRCPHYHAPCRSMECAACPSPRTSTLRIIDAGDLMSSLCFVRARAVWSANPVTRPHPVTLAAHAPVFATISTVTTHSVRGRPSSAQD